MIDCLAAGLMRTVVNRFTQALTEQYSIGNALVITSVFAG
jgi:hypothetical protein